VADSSDRIALPIRVHDFLLNCAGRIDDDALTDARELLAMAELDRAVELTTASLVAGRIRLTADERDELLDLVDAVRSSPALVDRVVVDDSAPLPRHRFTTGAMDDPSPEIGVLEAAGRVVEVLPDIRSLSCVWRTTPAGSPAGPVPQRVVLVETGPDGFAPSTAYRVEHALRRAGIRASVEVVQAGTELSDYHGDALAVARRVSLRSLRAHESHELDSGGLYSDQPTPRAVSTTRRRSTAGAHAEKRVPAEHAVSRWQPRLADDQPAADQEADPAPGPAPYVESHVEEPEPVAYEDPAPFEDGVRPIHPGPAPVEAVEVAVEPEPVVAPNAPTMAPAPQAVPPADPAAEADLSNRERELLRQLHEELAKREQAEPEPQGWQQHEPTPPGAEFDPADFRQPEFNPNEFGGPAWHQSPMLGPANGAADQTAVNGIPPYGSQGA
jgi:hypothetical protein